MSLLKELEWRGLVAGLTTRDLDIILKDGDPIRLYCGFDPTGPSLHIGSLVPLVVLKHFMNFGHFGVALLGGATGQIGDPSGKSTERNLLAEDIITQNTAKITTQIQKVLGPEIEIRNNIEWFQSMSALQFLRDIGKHFSVNQMLNMESVSKRLKRDEAGISFTEFAYSLLQSQDFLELFRTRACTLQIGGSDQWGNICSGIDLIRRLEKGRAFGLITPLLTDAAGDKIGKTEGATIWLDPIETKPFHFFQFWLNTSDDSVEKFLKMLTFFTKEEIADLISGPPAERRPQKALASAVTTLVHGQDVTDSIIRASKAVFSAPEEVNVDELEQVLADSPRIEISRLELEAGLTVVDLLVKSQLCSSKTDARRQIDQGGIRINNIALIKEANDRSIQAGDFLDGRILFLRKGKKNTCLVKLK